MAEVTWARPALEDLEAIHDFIARDSLFYARGTVEGILARARTLEHFPGRGRMVAEFWDPDIRELKEGRYRIIYRLRGDEVEVVCVWHSSRNMLPVKRFE